MINNDWDIVLKDLYNTKEFKELINNVKKEYDKEIIFPEKENMFKALQLTNYKNVKVVILGQDPYHGEGEANGLSFSVNEGVKIPPSLRNIYKELKEDMNIENKNTDLTKWAEEGVLLLNSVLTVKKDEAASHKDIGWNIFSDEVIRKLNEREEPIVFILWGAFARNKAKLLTNKKHLIIESNHPSPLSAYRGFFGSKPFSKTNEYLIQNKMQGINWQL